MDGNAFGQQGGLSGRMVSFSFKVEKSQLLSPKQTDYVIVNQDGSHCGGSVKFNGIVEAAAPSSLAANTSASFSPSGGAVKCEIAPEYGAAAALVKNEPQDHPSANLNDSGFSEMDPSVYPQQQTVVPKMEPGLGHWTGTKSTLSFWPSFIISILVSFADW